MQYYALFLKHGVFVALMVQTNKPVPNALIDQKAVFLIQAPLPKGLNVFKDRTELFTFPHEPVIEDNVLRWIRAGMPTDNSWKWYPAAR